MSLVAAMNPFDPWLERWSLTVDGAPIRTGYADLLPVLREGAHAMLKISRTGEERRGAALLDWYGGLGAVRVCEADGPALLMERPLGTLSLEELSRTGRDDQATRILCATVHALHAWRERPLPPHLVPLDVWFRSLESTEHPSLARPRAVARELLSDARSPIALHGDIHHGNVLHDSERGWLAIDPKGLLGERTFDYTNIFCNPDFRSATAPTVFARRLDVVVEAADIERERLLKWVLAYAGLSASWCMDDNDADGVALRLAIVNIASRHLRDAH